MAVRQELYGIFASPFDAVELRKAKHSEGMTDSLVNMILYGRKLYSKNHDSIVRCDCFGNT